MRPGSSAGHCPVAIFRGQAGIVLRGSPSDLTSAVGRTAAGSPCQTSSADWRFPVAICGGLLHTPHMRSAARRIPSHRSRSRAVSEWYRLRGPTALRRLPLAAAYEANVPPLVHFIPCFREPPAVASSEETWHKSAIGLQSEGTRAFLHGNTILPATCCARPGTTNTERRSTWQRKSAL